MRVSPAWCAATGAHAVPGCAPTTTRPRRAGPIPLRDVQAYYRDPARQVLAQQLNIRLDALDDDRLQEQEPLQAGFSALDQVAKRLFFDALEQGRFVLPEQAPAWLRLSGALPSGRLGVARLGGRTRSGAGPARSRPRRIRCLPARPPQRQPVVLALPVGARHRRRCAGARLRQ